jgi:hypothetical protein
MRRDPNYKRAFKGLHDSPQFLECKYPKNIKELEEALGFAELATEECWSIPPYDKKMLKDEKDGLGNLLLYYVRGFFSKEYELYQKFGIVPCVDPSKSFDKLTTYEVDVLNMAREITGIWQEPAPIRCGGPIEFPIKKNVSALNININFNNINSIESLKQYVDYLIDYRYKEYLSSVHNCNKLPKFNLSNYDIILEAGDMKAKGMTHEAISKVLFTKDTNVESAVRKVGHYCKKYLELINGGHKYLRYP